MQGPPGDTGGFGRPSPQQPMQPVQPGMMAQGAQESGAPRRSGAVLVIIVLVIILLLVLLFAGGLGLGYQLGWFGQRGEAGAASTPSGDVETAAGQAAESGDVVTFEVHSEPSGATIVMGGVTVGTTPYQVTFSRSDAVRELVVQKTGYVSIERRVQFEESQNLRFTLEPSSE